MAGEIPSFPLRWLYLDLNSYFASVEQQLNPHLRGQPVAVVPVMSDSTCAIAASYEAKKFGIRTGTPIYEAKRICPGIRLVEARHDAYVEYHHRIKSEIEKHVHVDITASIDEVACRLMDNENSREKAIATAHRIKAGIAKNVGEYLRSSIGIAPNKYLAKIATELEKPNGLVVIESSDLPHKLFTLSLRDLSGIGRNMEKRLLMHGINSIEQLYSYSPKQMRKIWHSLWGEKMWYYLRGYDIPDEETVRGSIGHSHVMAPELREPGQAIHVARRLTVKAASRLRRLGYYTSLMTFSARLESGERVAAEIRFHRACDNFTLLKALEEMWREVVTATGKARMKKVSVNLLNLTSESELQPGLFDDAPDMMQRGRMEKLSTAMDRINTKYGRDSILVGMTPTQGRSFSGTKIAFTRIPDMQEFVE